MGCNMLTSHQVKQLLFSNRKEPLDCKHIMKKHDLEVDNNVVI